MYISCVVVRAIIVIKVTLTYIIYGVVQYAICRSVLIVQTLFFLATSYFVVQEIVHITLVINLKFFSDERFSKTWY